MWIGHRKEIRKLTFQISLRWPIEIINQADKTKLSEKAEQKWRADQIVDLRDTDKSRYFAITELNNCFIVRLGLLGLGLLLFCTIYNNITSLRYVTKKRHY